MSIGKSSCQDTYLQILQNSDEYDKASSSAATTVMTLVPAMLTFAAMPMASIRSLNFINTRLALFTSALTLGLTMTYKKTLADDKTLKVTEICEPDHIERYGVGGTPGVNGDQLSGEIDELARLYDETGAVKAAEDEAPIARVWGNKELRRLASEIHGNKRSIYISLVITTSNVIQILLFGTLVRALPKIEEIRFIWGCPETTTIIFNSWLSVTAVLSAIIRTIAVSSLAKHDEVLHISPELGRPIVPTDKPPCDQCSVINLNYSKEGPWGVFTRASDRVNEFGRFFFRCKIPSLRFLKMTWLQRTFQRLGQPHPRIVVIKKAHRTANWSDEVKTALDGIVQSASILALTFMFGSIWGGSLEWTVLFVAAFMCVMWISRTVSLVVGRYLETSTGMTVIMHETEKEKTAILRILTGMPAAFVENKSNSSKFWHGYKLGNKCENCKTTLEQEWEDKTAPGVFYGLVFAIISGVGIFICFLAVTLPFDAPFLPHPYEWKNYRVATSVSLTLAVTYAVCFAFEFRSVFISDLIHYEVTKGERRRSTLRANSIGLPAPTQTV